MGFLRRIVGFLAIIIYILIGVYALVCLPMLFKYKPLVVLTGSMEPTFKVGSVIYYKRVSQNELKVGDAITFEIENEKFVSHRIVSIDDGYYRTKGDANDVIDVTKVSFNDIQGKDANLCVPYVGYYVKFINDNLRVVVITVIIILVSEFIFSNISAFDIDKKKERREEDEK